MIALSNGFFPLISGKRWYCLDLMSRVLNRNHMYHFRITNPIQNHPAKIRFVMGTGKSFSEASDKDLPVFNNQRP